MIRDENSAILLAYVIKSTKLQLPNKLKQVFWLLMQPRTGYFLAAIAILLFLVFQLSLIPTSSAPIEVANVQSSSNVSAILADPLSLPYKLASLVGLQVSDSVRVLRAISLLVFGSTVFALYRTLKLWHSNKIAIFATSMFASNAMVLSVSRLASPIVLLLGWTILVSLLLWAHYGRSRRIAPGLVLFVALMLLYVPGAPYFYALMGVLFYKKIKKQFSRISKKIILLGAVIGFALLMPLALALVQNTELIRSWLLLPLSIDWIESARNILRVPSAFLYRSPVDPLLSVGRLPVFDVAVGGLFLIGLYSYQQNSKLDRARIMLLTTVVAIIIGALGQVTAAIVILLPFVYAVVAAGISYLLDEWYTVFPRNPFARSFGVLLVTIVVLMSMYYQLTRFLVVWPNTPETRSQYNQSRLVQ